MPDQAYDPDCDFCKIVSGRDANAEVVCEAEDWVAFFPLEPATTGHTLVVPREHVPDLWSLDPSSACHLMEAVVRVGRAIERALEPEGMNLISSSGAVAEQTVFHVHLHVVPRWRRDGFGRIWPQESTAKRVDIENAGDLIRAACQF